MILLCVALLCRTLLLSVVLLCLALLCLELLCLALLFRAAVVCVLCCMLCCMLSATVIVVSHEAGSHSAVSLVSYAALYTALPHSDCRVSRCTLHSAVCLVSCAALYAALSHSDCCVNLTLLSAVRSRGRRCSRTPQPTAADGDAAGPTRIHSRLLRCGVPTRKQSSEQTEEPCCPGTD